MFRKIFLICLASVLFHPTAYAKDIEKFDLKGLTLGSSLGEVKNAFPCDWQYKKWETQGIVSGYQLHCSMTKIKEAITINFDHNKNAIHIYRDISLTKITDLEKTVSRLEAKYGIPDLTARSETGRKNPKNGFEWQGCWSRVAGCYLKTKNDGYWNGTVMRAKSSGKTLRVDFREYESDYGFGYVPGSIRIDLEDHDAEQRNDEWFKNKLDNYEVDF